jgi:hypothetical protein
MRAVKSTVVIHWGGIYRDITTSRRAVTYTQEMSAASIAVLDDSLQTISPDSIPLSSVKPMFRIVVVVAAIVRRFRSRIPPSSNVGSSCHCVRRSHWCTRSAERADRDGTRQRIVRGAAQRADGPGGNGEWDDTGIQLGTRRRLSDLELRPCTRVLRRERPILRSPTSERRKA